MTSDDVKCDKSEESDNRDGGRELSPEQAAAAAMVAAAKKRGLELTSPDGLLKLFTKSVLETALNEEMTEHLGHEKNQADPDRDSTNVRNAARSKTVISYAAGEVVIDAPRDREGTSSRRLSRNGSGSSLIWMRSCCRCMRNGSRPDGYRECMARKSGSGL